MPLPDLSQLPPWAVVLFVVSLAIIIGLAWIGERIGKRAPPAGVAEPAGRILGAVIDGRKADELIAAFNKVAVELADNTDAHTELASVVRANSAAAIAAGDDITNARTDIRELTRELARSGK